MNGLGDQDTTGTLGIAAVDTSLVAGSATSWSAILAGAAVAAALSLILLILGTGLGLSSISPWAHDGVSATTLGVSTILWITLMQVLASGMGGYLAGRLRSRWRDIQRDEVYFRDTAHGFLAWAVATLATAALLTSVIGSIVGGGIQAGASVISGVASTTVAAASGSAAAAGSTMANSDGDSGPIGYFVDSLFRKDLGSVSATPSPGETGASSGGMAGEAGTPSAEVTRILFYALPSRTLPPEDTRYIGQVVAQSTGMTQQEAEARVSDTFARIQARLQEAETAAKDTADAARKASAYAALWLFVSLLSGAFVASFAATIGGRQRDL